MDEPLVVVSIIAGLALLLAGLLARRSRAPALAPAQRRLLETHLPHYSKLEAPIRERFERRVQEFLAAKRFYGCGGFMVTDEMRVLIAGMACLLILRPEARTYAPRAQPSFRPPVDEEAATGGLKLGQRVQHKSFGEGTVLAFEGDGERLRIEVRFRDAGTKWLMLSFANLHPL